MEAIGAHDEPFIPGRPRYDQSTFQGRFRHFLDVADPRCLAPKLFFGMSLDEASAILSTHKENPSAKIANDKLWLASKIHTSAIHPDTGERVPQPFRMCGFAVYGTPVVVAMMVPTSSMAWTIFAQSANQTHNACVNYANRNASQGTTGTQIAQGYAGALTLSVGIALGLKEAIKRANISATARATLLKFSAFPAVAAASTGNMLLMRRGELESGIHVKDHEGTVHGTSQVAAKEALTQMAFTRAFLPAPLLIIPPMVMMVLGRTSLLRRYPRLHLPVETLVCVGAFVFGLPLSLALFPQEGSIEASKLEPRFHNLRDKAGNPVETLTFNKGL